MGFFLSFQNVYLKIIKNNQIMYLNKEEKYPKRNGSYKCTCIKFQVEFQNSNYFYCLCEIQEGFRGYFILLQGYFILLPLHQTHKILSKSMILLCNSFSKAEGLCRKEGVKLHVLCLKHSNYERIF